MEEIILEAFRTEEQIVRSLIEGKNHEEVVRLYMDYTSWCNGFHTALLAAGMINMARKVNTMMEQLRKDIKSKMY